MLRPAALLIVALTLLAARPPSSRPDPSELVGTWQVDLRPAPEAEPYYQDLTIRSAQEGTLTGSFYGSSIEEGRYNADWGAVHFAFVTRDGSGVYHTSGVLRDGALAGTTHALGRQFLAVWTAAR